MKRGKPLRAKTPSKGRELQRLVVDVGVIERKRAGRARSRSSYASRERHVVYMSWVKSLPCLLGGWWPRTWRPRVQQTPCGGVVEADHAGDRGIGRKAPDSTCIPLCTNHHGQRTDGASRKLGAFGYFDRNMMADFRYAAVKIVQLRANGDGVEVPDDGGRCAAYVAAVAKRSAAPGTIPW